MAASYLAVVLLAPTTVAALEREDGPLETAGALTFLAAALVFFKLYGRDPQGNDFTFLKTSKNIFFLLLGLLFFAAFGEEISWGQRLLGFATPESVAELNRKDEFNVHNLGVFEGESAILNLARVFSLFWFTYCVVIPTGALLRPDIREWLRRVNLPLVPLWLGLAFPLNYGASKVLERVSSAEGAVYASLVVEVKESLFGFLFLAVAVFFLAERTPLEGRERRWLFPEWSNPVAAHSDSLGKKW